MRRMHAALGIEVDEEQLPRAAEEHSWEKIPERGKVEGKFYRKATRGGRGEDLRPGQAGIVERITALPFEEFYPGACLEG